MSELRVPVRKTYKLYIGGAFPRSESGRTYVVTDGNNTFMANAALASRKDARDAVVAARKVQPQWAAATAYNRGQVLYRLAEMLEERRSQFVDLVRSSEGVSVREATLQVDVAVDRVVWYAGWADKVAQVTGTSNPVAGPYFNFSVPMPTGVVAIVAPQRSSLLGFVSVVLPVIVSGNTAVVLASQDRPLPAMSMAEVFATSDVPAGVVNVLTGKPSEIAPVLASHRDVDAIDLCGVRAESAADLERDAAGNVKRVVRADVVEPDWTGEPTPKRMLSFVEIKTVWHTLGI